jgi:hypothetical protein
VITFLNHANYNYQNGFKSVSIPGVGNGKKQGILRVQEASEVP